MLSLPHLVVVLGNQSAEVSITDLAMCYISKLPGLYLRST